MSCSKRLQLGKKNVLKAAWRVDFGMYLEGGGYEDKILLPERYVPEDLKVRREKQNVGDYNSYNGILDGVKACGRLLEPTDHGTVLHCG